MKFLTMSRSAIAVLALLVPGLVISCTASVQGGGAGPNGSGAGSGPTNSGSGGASGPAGSGGSTLPPVSQPPSVTGTPTPESAGVMVMRRLTNREYSNIMADLLGDTTSSGSAFPLDGPTATGFEAPNSVADLNVQYYMQSADVLAEAALQGGKLTIPCTNPAAGAAETTCAGNFISTFGRRAYRRPVAATERTDLLAVFSKARSLGFNFTASIAQTVKAIIQSPNFLYHWEIGPTKPVVDVTGLAGLTQHQVASRLSLLLWENMPDEMLLTAADMGQLATPAQIKAQAQRMLADPHAANALFNFHAQWLLQVNGHVTELNEITKSSAVFSDAVKQALPTEFTQFLTSVYATGDGTLNSLLTAPYAYVNAALAPIYGVTATGTGFSKVQLNPTQRAGILTQTAFLAANADPSADNPVRRGLAVYLNLLCGQVGQPPAVVPDLAPPTTATTTRQRFDAHAQSACAQGCHNLFDPPGFAFENYDAIGGYRTTEAGQPVDAAGSFTTPGGAKITFRNAVDLVTQLAQSDEAKWCVDRQWFRYMLGRPETSAEQGSMELAYLTGRATTGYSLREMMLTMVTSKSFLYRMPAAGEVL
jgi:hypothetical protein